MNAAEKTERLAALQKLVKSIEPTGKVLLGDGVDEFCIYTDHLDVMPAVIAAGYIEREDLRQVVPGAGFAGRVSACTVKPAPMTVFTPAIGHHADSTLGGTSRGQVAHVSGDQNPAQYEHAFDAAATIMLLRASIAALENGDGITAVRACGAAWFRISAFHHG